MESDNFAAAVLIQAIVFGVLGSIVGVRKNAAGTGFILGFLFSLIGVLLAFAADNRPKCTSCATRIDPSAKVCPSCHAEVIATSRSRWKDPYKEPIRPPLPVPKKSKLIPCPDCDREISAKAVACPHCGCPV